MFSVLTADRWRLVPIEMWHILRTHRKMEHTPAGVDSERIFVDPATHALLVGRRVIGHAREDGYVTHVSTSDA